ncbi:hypothetical protein ABZX62_04910 [Streptomyces flavidovirens]|uniref:hypothetical protein n=1 Tax=Streptomyces flavidovirens TaxID=67298 RepID=UPI0033A16EA3
MRLADAVAMAGGSASHGVLEDVLTPAGAAAANEALTFVREGTEATDGLLALEVVNSNSMTCAARRLEGRDSVVLIPLGVIARARALARRLLQHLAHGKSVRVVGNPLDYRPGWEIAPGLVPVYGQYEGDDEHQWDALKSFDGSTEPDESRDTAASDIMSLCLLYLAMHEMTHVVSRHDRLLELVRSSDPRVPSMSLPVLRRGLEINADIMAAVTTARCLAMVSLLSAGAKEKGIALGVADTGLDTLFERCSFAATMLFSMYDTHRATVFNYDEGSYPHPLIRYEHTHEATLEAIKSFAPDLLETVVQSTELGWLRCNQAISELENACLFGEYGKPADGNILRCLPVTALKYGTPVLHMQSRIAEEYRLGIQIEGLLVLMNGLEDG